MPYKKGQSGNPKGRAKKQPPPDLPPGDDDELVVMRHVRSNPKDETYQQWQSRQERERDRAGWEEFYRRLEVNDRKAKGSSTTPPATLDAPPSPTTASGVPSDPGTARSMELLSEEWARLEPLLDGVRSTSGPASPITSSKTAG